MEPIRKKSPKENDDMNANSESIPESTTKMVLDNESSSSDSESSSDFDREYSCDLCKTKFSGFKSLKQHERSEKHLKKLRKQKLKKAIEEGDDNSDSSDEDFSLDRNQVYKVCEDCDKEFNGPESYHLHMKSKRHKKKVANNKILEMSKEDGKVNVEKLKQIIKGDSSTLKEEDESDLSESEEDSKSGVFECETCDKVFTGLEPFRDHLSSKTHGKILKQKKRIEKLISDPNNTIVIVDDVLICELCRKSFSGPESARDHLKSKGHLEWLEFKKWKKEKKNSEKRESELSPEASTSTEPKEKDTSSKTADFNEPGSDAATNDNQEKRNSQARIAYKNYKEVMNESKTLE